MTKKNRFFIFMVAAVIWILCLCSCGESTDGVTLNGKPLKMPCKINDLNGDFEYAPEIYFNVIYNTTKVMLTYNGEEFGLAEVNITDKNKLSDADISSIVTTSQSGLGNMKVDGAGFGSTRSEVLSAIKGTPEKTDGVLKFYEDGYKVIIFFDESDKVNMISADCENQ